MLSEQTCDIFAEYSPCNDTYFDCVITEMDSAGNYNSSSCVEDFMDAEFWAAMREEQWWMDNWSNHSEFYEFWDEYHADDEEHCEWKFIEATCDDFDFTDDICEVFLSYSPCETEYFHCEVFNYDADGNANGTENCTESFQDPMFWSMMREEQFWQDNWEQTSDFYEFWDEWHNNTDECYDHCYDPYDCADEFGVEECMAHYCYNVCDFSESCNVDYKFNGTEGNMDCEEFA